MGLEKEGLDRFRERRYDICYARPMRINSVLDGLEKEGWKKVGIHPRWDVRHGVLKLSKCGDKGFKNKEIKSWVSSAYRWCFTIL